jgi:hypothetical protein
MTTKWTVKPFYTPHEDSDPLGVFEVKEVKAEAEKWEDASMDAAPNSEQEQHAIDRKGEVTEQAARLIAAAPDLLEALQGYVAHIESCRAAWEEDGAERNTKMHGLAVALNNIFGDRIEEAIAKATGEPVMAA